MLSGIPIPKDAVRPPETVLVNITPQETRVAVLEENNICELHIERNSGHSLVGNIYLGVVKRVLPGMQSAFIDIGLERAAFCISSTSSNNAAIRTKPNASNTCSLKASLSWFRSLKTPSTPKARACPPKSHWPAVSSSIFRKKTTSAFPNALKTMPNATA